MIANVRIAITADWLTASGGAERVIDEMCHLWPEAPIFTTVWNKKEYQPCFGTPHCVIPSDFARSETEGKIVSRGTQFSTQHDTVKTSYLQPLYNLIHTHKPLLPLMPRAVESWDLRGFDIILSSSHAVAKGCIPPSTARHICYCHTPMRYAWEMEEKYLDDFRLWGPLRLYAKNQLKRLREWDLTTAKRVDLFIANSHETAKRIERIYDRESVVLHPPVADTFFDQKKETCNVQRATNNYFLALGRLVPYKRFDLLIESANKAKFNLVIAGDGQERKRLEEIAGPTVTFLGRVGEEELINLYTNANAFLFPVHEDAGITPLEAQACGTPVIAYGKGGALDTVKNGETGIFFEKQTSDALIDAIQRFEKMPFDTELIKAHAKQFSASRFRERLACLVAEY